MPLLGQIHYVYHLSVDKEIVYVGRSILPKVRQGVFARKYGVETCREEFGPFLFATAAIKEIEDIKNLKPRFNKYLASSPTRLGYTNSIAHNSAISKALSGVPKSKEHKNHLWINRGALSTTPKNIKRRLRRSTTQ